MASSVVRMGRKLGLVGNPRIWAAAANIRTVLCQKNRHLATNTNAGGLSEGGKTQGLLNAETDATDKTDLYKGTAALTLAAVGWAYLEYEKSYLEARQDAAYNKLAYNKLVEARSRKG